MINIEVIFKIKPLFIPTHRIDQRLHGMLTAVKIFLFNIDPQDNLTTAPGNEMVFNQRKVACNHCKQIRWFREGVLPAHPMTATRQITGLSHINIAETISLNKRMYCLYS